jgi:hypothetical protein
MPEAKGGGPALRYTKDGAIAWIAADNPARMNALTASMWQAIPDAISAATSDPGVRVVVLRGAGDKAFSAGADISEFENARTGDAAKVYDALNDAAFNALIDCPKPTIHSGRQARHRLQCTMGSPYPRRRSDGASQGAAVYREALSFGRCRGDGARFAARSEGGA